MCVGSANGVNTMKINPLSSYNLYSSYAKGTGKVRRTAVPAPESAGKTDTISFSPEAREQQELSQVTGSILNELNEPESASRLQAIQKAIQDNTYRVSTDELADAILSRSSI